MFLEFSFKLKTIYRESNDSNQEIRTRGRPSMYRIARIEGREPNVHIFKKRSAECSFCKAKMFIEEKVAGNKSNPIFSNCCAKGKVVLPELPELPAVISNLFPPKPSKKHKEIKEQIRLYNNVLAFTHLNANLDEKLMQRTRGTYTFKINGSIHHCLPPITPTDNKPHRFAQIYFLDAESQLNQRLTVFKDLDRDILGNLQRFILQNNPFAQLYKNIGIFKN